MKIRNAKFLYSNNNYSAPVWLFLVFLILTSLNIIIALELDVNHAIVTFLHFALEIILLSMVLAIIFDIRKIPKYLIKNYYSIYIGFLVALCCFITSFSLEVLLGERPEQSHTGLFLGLVSCIELVGFLIILLALRNLVRNLYSSYCLAKRHSLTDWLTLLPNRRGFFESPNVTSNCRQAILVLDIDHFKSINDVYGHERGDRVLKVFAEMLRESTLGHDFCARLGGEEFVISIYEGDESKAVTLAKKVIQRTEEIHYDVDRSLTVSIGISIKPEGGDILEALRIADKALYKSKKNGRNRYEFSS